VPTFSMLKKIRNTWAAFSASDKVSVAALAVSLVAIGIGIHDSRLTREHERLSVVPKLSIKFVDGSDSDITGILLENDGLGPARVLNVRLSVDGRYVGENTESDKWNDVFNELHTPHPHVRYLSSMTDWLIPAGKSVPLLWQRNNELTDSARAFLQDAKNRLEVSSCFCSLYNECWSVVAPGQQDEPCESPLARYLLLNKGPLADALKGHRRVIEPWSVH
jgi:hypothetical protein